jgi:hypothetical protein
MRYWTGEQLVEVAGAEGSADLVFSLFVLELLVVSLLRVGDGLRLHLRLRLRVAPVGFRGVECREA